MFWQIREIYASKSQVWNQKRSEEKRKEIQKDEIDGDKFGDPY